MLTISRELAIAFEQGTLGRWKAEIAALIRRQFPAEANNFPGARMDDWVRGATDSIRRMGVTARGDIEHFAVTLFLVTEVDADDRAAEDFVAIMLGSGTMSAKMSMLRKGFPRPE